MDLTKRSPQKKKAFLTFIRMILYPSLAVALTTALYFNPHVQTEYNLSLGSLEGNWKGLYGAGHLPAINIKKDGTYSGSWRFPDAFWWNSPEPLSLCPMEIVIATGTWSRTGRKLKFNSKFLGDWKILSWTRDGMYMKSKDGVAYWQRVSDDGQSARYSVIYE